MMITAMANGCLIFIGDIPFRPNAVLTRGPKVAGPKAQATR